MKGIMTGKNPQVTGKFALAPRLCASAMRCCGQRRPASVTAPCAGPSGESGQVLFQESGQLCLVEGAHLGGGQLAILEQHQRGNAADAELGGDLAVLVHIHLGDGQLFLVGLRCFVEDGDRKSTRLNSSHTVISYAVFCLKKKKKKITSSYKFYEKT